MQTITIPYIVGDDVGAEITPAMLKVVNAAVEKCYQGEKSIDWKEVLAGEKAYNAVGNYLPEETLETFKNYKIGINKYKIIPVIFPKEIFKINKFTMKNLNDNYSYFFHANDHAQQYLFRLFLIY